ncbi:mucin-2-like isoform X3, partial [Clarias magur]
MQLNYIVWVLLAMQGIFSVTTTGFVPAPSCCTETSSNKVRVTEIVRYILQEKPLCPIKAV